MNIIFIEPSFPSNQREFVRALHKAGANVIGIGERPVDYLDSEVQGWLKDYVQVRSVVHEPSLLKAVKLIQGQLIGEERITVGHERRDSKHYLIAGQINRHLWYDLDCRLVRLQAPLRDGSEVVYEVPGGI